MSKERTFEFTGEYRRPKEGEWFASCGPETAGRRSAKAEQATADRGFHTFILIPHPIPEPDAVPVKVETLRRVLEDILPGEGGPSFSTKNVAAARGILQSLIPKPTLEEEIKGLRTFGEQDEWQPNEFRAVVRILDILRKRGIDLEARE